MSRKEKIFILGIDDLSLSNDSTTVESCSWEKLDTLGNLRDYDVLIISLLSIDQFTLDQSKILQKKLTLFTTKEIIDNNGTIIIIGDPRVKLEVEALPGKTGMRDFLYWTGANYYWVSGEGNTKKGLEEYKYPEFKNYIDEINEWSYSLASAEVDLEELRTFYKMEVLKRNNWKLGIDFTKICVNRAGNSIVFLLRLGIYSEDDEQSRLSGPIIFLPQIEKSEEETIRIVLRDFFRCDIELPEPDWLDHYKAPDQESVEEIISQRKKELNEVQALFVDSENKLEIVRECLKLLYAGEGELEPVVRKTLSELGSKVEDPEGSNKEDGWVSKQIGADLFEAVIEIKSTRGQHFSEDGIRQLHEWYVRGIELRKKKYKRLFIGNSDILSSPVKRPDPYSSSWLESARLSDISVLKTVDLFSAYKAFKEGKLDTEKFWKSVFTTNGIVNVSESITEDKTDPGEAEIEADIQK